MTADGDMVGTVDKIHDDEAHVRVDTGLSGSIRSKLGWEDENETVYPLKHENVDKIQGDEIHLESRF
ncbi:hypothetical protein [Halorubellus salinus]|uniref:hypothetical protein n=1 Tax=Halorubellus salinus TaxID=755309 RepID=UPI001D09690A|nr:hypothetical protein [Halorubellus salinus]